MMGVVRKILSGVLSGFVVGGGEQKEAKFANGAKPFPVRRPRRFLALKILLGGLAFPWMCRNCRCVANSFLVRGKSKVQVLLRSKEIGFGTSNDWVSSTQTW
jgi:hypothetical protein